jgi:tryptophan synthase beta subunit
MTVKLLGVEAGGDGIDTSRHSATLSVGTPGVLHGVKTYLLQNVDGQISDTHSVCRGQKFFNCAGLRRSRLQWCRAGTFVLEKHR